MAGQVNVGPLEADSFTPPGGQEKEGQEHDTVLSCGDTGDLPKVLFWWYMPWLALLREPIHDLEGHGHCADNAAVGWSATARAAS